MTKLLNSTFETYLMDQELEVQASEGKEIEEFEEVYDEHFPAGFFTSL